MKNKITGYVTVIPSLISQADYQLIRYAQRKLNPGETPGKINDGTRTEKKQVRKKEER